MNLLQAQLIFPTHAVPAAGPLPSGAEKLEVVTPGGERLRGAYFPPRGGENERTLVLGFGGNGWNGQHVGEYLARTFPQAHVVAFHYRGYHPSTGNPSAEALKEDAPLVFDHAAALVKPDKVVAVGLSIGSGVAANLARHRRLDGLILVTPFDSLKAVASEIFPWVPVGPFFKHELATAEDIAEVNVPVAVLAAEQDEIVHPRRTVALRRAVPNLIFDRTIDRAGHNDIYQRKEFEGAMNEAFCKLTSGQNPR
ncbi:MAG TPA: alpha/beta fold hydrolase [Sphingomicrobium sp.]|nr:alpha/beta fold hydrolase [Sphingomicrobium sp.]